MTGDSAADAPRVAVVIPCFNDGATLGEAVASAREPAQESAEIVIVDDGSSDEATLALLERLEREGVRVLRQENSGPAAARMTGLAAVSSPYVFPLDADDLLEPGALTALADALDADPKAAAAWGDWSTFGDARVPCRSGKWIDPWLITYVNLMPGESCFRRSVLLEVGGWTGSRSSYEDWNLWLGIAERGHHGVYLPIEMMRYRIHGSRMWHSSLKRHDDVMVEMEVEHPLLFSARAENRRRSPAPRRLKLLLPLVDRMTFLPARARMAISNLLVRPVSTLRKAVGTRRAGLVRRPKRRS